MHCDLQICSDGVFLPQAQPHTQSIFVSDGSCWEIIIIKQIHTFTSSDHSLNNDLSVWVAPAFIKSVVARVHALMYSWWLSLRRAVAKKPRDRLGLCEYVIVHTILGGGPVILWISLGGKPKWPPLKSGYHDVMAH